MKMNAPKTLSLVAVLGASGFVMSAIPASAQFYVRADTGYAWTSDTEVKDVPGSGPAAALGTNFKMSGDVGDSAVFSGGIGYIVSPFLRIDILGTYRPSFQFDGKANRNFLGATPSTQSMKMDVSTLSASLNGYLELAGFFPNTFSVVRPYVGGGVGMSRNSTEQGLVRYTGSAAVAGTYPVYNRTVVSPTWSAGGGVAYALSSSWSLDLSYRYSDLGKIETAGGKYVGQGGLAAASADIGRTRGDLKVQEVTLGLRYGF
jgi:opacity protein-like surface antigen